MKKTLYYLFCFAFFYACKTDIQPLTFESISVENDFEADISLIYDEVKPNNDLTKSINNTIKSQIINSIDPDENGGSLETTLKKFNTEYLNFIDEFPDASSAKWELHTETEKMYQSDAIITMAISTYEYRGGAHGNDQIKLININTKNGELIKIPELINDTLKLKKVAQHYFIKELETNNKSEKLEDYFFGRPFQLPENIGLSEEGLIMLYNTYEIASYAQGYTEFIIPFEDALTLLEFN